MVNINVQVRFDKAEVEKLLIAEAHRLRGTDERDDTQVTFHTAKDGDLTAIVLVTRQATCGPVI